MLIDIVLQQLSNKRRVQVSQFGKTWFVNIREFYEANGKMLPGKKVRLHYLKGRSAIHSH